MTRPGNRINEGTAAVRDAPRVELPSQRGATLLPTAPTPTASLPRVVVIDHDAVSAQQLAHALTEPGFAVAIAADSVEAAIEAIGHTSDAATNPMAADLAVVSLRLGPDASNVVAHLRAAGVARVIVLSTTATLSGITAALAAGATGAVIAGRAAPARNVPTGIYDLSPREVEVIRLVADGRSNKWIGENLELSSLTVKSHLARIGRKLGTGDRAHMVALALRAGIIN